MITVVGGIKGGSGKTIIATNLAVMRSKVKKVLFVDADDQETASDWYDQRRGLGHKSAWEFLKLTGSHIHDVIKGIKHQFDDIIIDVGGRDTTSQRSALGIADVYVTPFRPKSPDIWTAQKLVFLINDMRKVNNNLNCLAFINQADPTGKDNLAAIQMLSEYSEIKCFTSPICLRKSFSNAFAEGLSIIELKTQDEKAICEMKALYKAIYK